MDTVKDCLTAALTSSKKKFRPANFQTVAETRRQMLPLRNFFLQYVIDAYGLPQHNIVDIMGAPHVGKTGLLHLIMGDAMTTMGSPCYIQHSEGKPYARDWAIRFLDTDPTAALHKADFLLTEAVHSLTHSIESLEAWVNSMRGRAVPGRKTVNVPLEIPLVVGIDTWTKLMNPSEEAGRYVYGENMEAEQKKKRNEIGEGSNMGHAKFAAGMGRTLPAFLEQNNVILILVRHVFDKVDMGAKKGSSMSAETSQMYNTTSTGGKTFEQSAAVQFILGRKGQAKDGSGDLIGDIVRCRCSKNSYGEKGRIIEWILRNAKFRDTETYLQPAIDFDEGMGMWLATDKYLGVTVDSKRYSCKSLGVTAVPANELAAAFHANPQIQFTLGKKLKMGGYIDYVDEIKKQLKAAEDAKKETAEAAALADKEDKLALKNAKKDPKTIDVEATTESNEAGIQQSSGGENPPQSGEPIPPESS